MVFCPCLRPPTRQQATSEIRAVHPDLPQCIFIARDGVVSLESPIGVTLISCRVPDAMYGKVSAMATHAKSHRRVICATTGWYLLEIDLSAGQLRGRISLAARSLFGQCETAVSALEMNVEGDKVLCGCGRGGFLLLSWPANTVLRRWTALPPARVLYIIGHSFKIHGFVAILANNQGVLVFPLSGVTQQVSAPEVEMALLKMRALDEFLLTQLHWDPADRASLFSAYLRELR